MGRIGRKGGMGRGVAVLLVAPFLTFASALAPQHVHEPSSLDDHHHAVAHSHFAPHDHSAPHNETTEIEHNDADGPVVWLDSAILHRSPPRIAPAISTAAVGRDVVAPAARWSVTAVDDAAPPHGPPKPVRPLRGPPS